MLSRFAKPYSHCILPYQQLTDVAMKPIKPPKRPHETWRSDNDTKEQCKYHDGEFDRQVCYDNPFNS